LPSTCPTSRRRSHDARAPPSSRRKLAGKAVDRFLAAPDPAIVAAVIYGPDEGLVRERAEHLVTLVAIDPKDPFRVAELPASAVESDPARLADEADQLPMTGGRRVLRLRDAGDEIAKALLSWLDAGAAGARDSGGFVVIEAGDLGPRSGLRKLAETHPRAASIPCYRDEIATLQTLAREKLKAEGLTIAPEAMQWLATHLGADRAITARSGEAGRVELADVLAVVGDSAELALDDLVYAVGDGELPALERATQRSFAEGAAPIMVLRTLGRHFLKVQLAKGLARDAGIEAAIARIRPPIFFKYVPRFKTQVARWTEPMLAEALSRIVEAERNCKRSALPAQTICHAALMAIAQLVRAEQRRAG
jgi:DNA polymerase-3 subunit delta